MAELTGVQADREANNVLRSLALGHRLRLSDTDAKWQFEMPVARDGWRGGAFVYPPPQHEVSDIIVECLLEDGFAKREHSGTSVVATERGCNFLRAHDLMAREIGVKMAVSQGSVARPVAPHHKRLADLEAKRPAAADKIGHPQHRNEGEEVEYRRLVERVAAEKAQP